MFKCDNAELIPYDGHIICKKCGLYLHKEIDNIENGEILILQIKCLTR